MPSSARPSRNPRSTPAPRPSPPASNGGRAATELGRPGGLPCAETRRPSAGSADLAGDLGGDDPRGGRPGPATRVGAIPAVDQPDMPAQAAGLRAQVDDVTV